MPWCRTTDPVAYRIGSQPATCVQSGVVGSAVIVVAGMICVVGEELVDVVVVVVAVVVVVIVEVVAVVVVGIAVVVVVVVVDVLNGLHSVTLAQAVFSADGGEVLVSEPFLMTL